MATLGLLCCAGFSQVVASGGYPLAVRRLIIAVASHVAEQRLCGTQSSVVAFCRL